MLYYLNRLTQCSQATCLFFFLLTPTSFAVFKLLYTVFTAFKLNENLWEVTRVSAACFNIQPLTMGHMW